MADSNDFFSFLGAEAVTGRIQSQCEEYLEGEIFNDEIRLGPKEYVNELELFATNGTKTIQKVIKDQESDTIHLRTPAPTYLPLKISRIFNDNNSFIIPSKDLDINILLPRSPKYQLEAIICDINQCIMIYMKDLSNNEWYHYQKLYSCQSLGKELSDNLNEIIESQSTSEQKRLIRSSHFLISIIFYNAIKYIYKQQR